MLHHVTQLRNWMETIHNYVENKQYVKARIAALAIPVFSALCCFNIMKSFFFEERNAQPLPLKDKLIVLCCLFWNIIFGGYFGCRNPIRNYRLQTYFGFTETPKSYASPQLSPPNTHSPPVAPSTLQESPEDRDLPIEDKTKQRESKKPEFLEALPQSKIDAHDEAAIETLTKEAKLVMPEEKSPIDKERASGGRWGDWYWDEEPSQSKSDAVSIDSPLGEVKITKAEDPSEERKSKQAAISDAESESESVALPAAPPLVEVTEEENASEDMKSTQTDISEVTSASETETLPIAPPAVEDKALQDKITEIMKSIKTESRNGSDLIGYRGSGKSTTLKFLAGAYDATEDQEVVDFFGKTAIDLPGFFDVAEDQKVVDFFGKTAIGKSTTAKFLSGVDIKYVPVQPTVDLSPINLLLSLLPETGHLTIKKAKQGDHKEKIKVLDLEKAKNFSVDPKVVEFLEQTKSLFGHLSVAQMMVLRQSLEKIDEALKSDGVANPLTLVLPELNQNEMKLWFSVCQKRKFYNDCHIFVRTMLKKIANGDGMSNGADQSRLFRQTVSQDRVYANMAAWHYNDLYTIATFTAYDWHSLLSLYLKNLPAESAQRFDAFKSIDSVTAMVDAIKTLSPEEQSMVDQLLKLLKTTYEKIWLPEDLKLPTHQGKSVDEIRPQTIKNMLAATPVITKLLCPIAKHEMPKTTSPIPQELLAALADEKRDPQFLISFLQNFTWKE